MSMSSARPRWRCYCQDGSRPCRIPPSPDVMRSLYMEYMRNNKGAKLTFEEYLAAIGFTDPSVDINGMDDKVLAERTSKGELDLIAIPSHPVNGDLRIIVLLVDFSDRPGTREPGHYEDLLFSDKTHPTGSMRDYYTEVSNNKVTVIGSVHGWLRMPQTYAYYVNKHSGMGDYPNNCQRLAEDATKVALAAGVKFSPDLDKLQRKFVTALFIVHAGSGAEKGVSKEERDQEIWSHKWTVDTPVEVEKGGLSVTTYLVVPQNCKLGVCAHELGHLAFQWQDFYDPNSDQDGEFWNGSGNWDLMASGCYNYGEAKPAHPAALHKLQHGWVQKIPVTSSQKVTLKPTTTKGGGVCCLTSSQFAKSQYLLLESRPQVGFDAALPGQGLLVWRVDESKEMYAPATPGMLLIQADGRAQLQMPDPSYQGDEGDAFPGSENVVTLKDKGETSTSFPRTRSGITLSNIRFDANGVASFTVTVKKVRKASAAKASAKAAPRTPAERAKRKPPITKRPSGEHEVAGQLKEKLVVAAVKKRALGNGQKARGNGSRAGRAAQSPAVAKKAGVKRVVAKKTRGTARA